MEVPGTLAVKLVSNSSNNFTYIKYTVSVPMPAPYM